MDIVRIANIATDQFAVVYEECGHGCHLALEWIKEKLAITLWQLVSDRDSLVSRLPGRLHVSLQDAVHKEDSQPWPLLSFVATKRYVPKYILTHTLDCGPVQCQGQGQGLLNFRNEVTKCNASEIVSEIYSCRHLCRD